MTGDSVAEKLWAAEALFGEFESLLDDLVGEFGRLGHDYYDGSLEIHEAANDMRLNEAAQRLIHEGGFSVVYVNHIDGWETHYKLADELPVRGWRRRYISDETVSTTRVIAGPPDPGYWEISYWPEGWDQPQTMAELDRGYYRIVTDPLEPAGEAATLDPTGEKA